MSSIRDLIQTCDLLPSEDTIGRLLDICAALDERLVEVEAGQFIREEDMQSTEQEAGFWALVELFGHQQIAGFVSSQTIGGEAFIRVDVPRTEKQENWSKLFGKGAIYAMTPMAEDLVKQRASVLEVAPLTAWDLPDEWREKIKQKRLPSTTRHELDEFAGDDDCPM